MFVGQCSDVCPSFVEPVYCHEVFDGHGMEDQGNYDVAHCI